MTTTADPPSGDPVWNLVAVCFAEGRATSDHRDVIEVTRPWLSPNALASFTSLPATDDFLPPRQSPLA